MNPEFGELAEEYASALESYLAGRGDAALQEAYDLGRKTLARGPRRARHRDDPAPRAAKVTF